MRRRPCKPARRPPEQAEALEWELSVRLEEALKDAEPTLKRRAKRLCEYSGYSGDAPDLLQDTYERAVRQGIPLGVRSTRAWLVKIMHNLFIDRRRAVARQPNHQEFEEKHANVTQLETETPEPPWSRITIDDIREALEEVEPLYRDVYKLHTFEHLSYEQIAQQLLLPPATVGTRLTRARKRLREVLVKRFGLEDES